jgi:hypothetical protein
MLGAFEQFFVKTLQAFALERPFELPVLRQDGSETVAGFAAFSFTGLAMDFGYSFDTSSESIGAHTVRARSAGYHWIAAEAALHRARIDPQ